MRTLIKNARVFNTGLKKFIPGWLLLEDGYIRYAFVEEDCLPEADCVIDAKGAFCLPSLIDIHLHIESSMITPATFSHALLRRGVTTCVAEPHEIANVLGIEGVRAFMKAARGCKMDIFWGIPSSVPCSGFETTGGRIELDDAKTLLDEPDVACLGEVMDCYSVLHEPDGKIRTWLEYLRTNYPKLTIEGHISNYVGAELCDIMYRGVDSDHTCIGLAPFIERLKMGTFIELQEKSLLPEVISYIEENDVWEHFSLVTDDVMPDLLRNRGHLDYLVRKAIGMGMKPERAILAATWNPARRMKMYDRGMIAAGYKADLLFVDDPVRFSALKVMKDGETVFDAEQPPAEPPRVRCFPEHFYRTVKLNMLTAENFDIVTPLPNGTHTARAMRPDKGTGRTYEDLVQVQVEDGKVQLQDTPLCRIAVFDRHTGRAGRMIGLVSGDDFLKKGAVACTYAHDHHNLLVAGKRAEDCAVAANQVIANQGGYCVVENGKILAWLPLEVGGIVTEAPLSETADRAGEVAKAMHYLGYEFDNPVMSFSVLGLSVSMFLRITDRGYVAAKEGKLLPLFPEEKKR